MFWCTWCTCTVTLHKTNWVGKYQDLFIGTKFCNICKYAIRYGAFYLIFVTIFLIRLIAIILMISGVYAETIWSVYFRQICVSLLVCGTCKLSVIPLLLSPSCKLCILKLFIYHMSSDVRNNSLTGSIPSNVGNCTSFQVLYVPQLKLHNCSVWIYIYIYCMDHVELCFVNARDLSYNDFNGEIPFNIGFLQVATLWVDFFPESTEVLSQMMSTVHWLCCMC